MRVAASMAGTALSVRLRGGTPGAVDSQRARLGDRDVILARCDPTERRGALTPADGDTLTDAAHHALAAKLPLVMSIASSGADVTAGLAATFGWGRAARAITECSGIVPVMMVAAGPAVSGPALLLGLADQVVMTADAYAFMSGPLMVRQITGVTVETDELGGTGVHAAQTGLASLVSPDPESALDAVADILRFLPSHTDEPPPSCVSSFLRRATGATTFVMPFSRSRMTATSSNSVPPGPATS